MLLILITEVEITIHSRGREKSDSETTFEKNKCVYAKNKNAIPESE